MNTLPETALEKYNELTVDSVEPDPIERLRFFLSLSLKGQDWLDVEKFIDDLQIPDGYKLMPIKLTDKMRWSASLEMPLHHGRLDKMYKAMIAASPSIST